MYTKEWIKFEEIWCSQKMFKQSMKMKRNKKLIDEAQTKNKTKNQNLVHQTNR